jgi:hypothetical protein
MKTISFRVTDEIYFSLKKKNVSFRQLFERYAYELAQNSGGGLTHTPCMQSKNSKAYIYLCQIKEIIKKFEDEQ